MNIGNNIKIYRKKLGITQEELAGQLCVTAQAVSKWESGTGLPDTAQIVPLAKMLNVTTDALFGLDEQANDYDRDEASAVTQKAHELRDNKDDWVKGAIDAADYLDKQCQNRPYNYGILTRYVQATVHLSRFIDGTYGIKLFEGKEDDWASYSEKAIKRGIQVIRYSNDRTLCEMTHFAMAWIYIHEREWDKAQEHISNLPTVNSNQLQESINSEFELFRLGKKAWSDTVRLNLQNLTRAINKVMVYASETCLAICEPKEAEKFTSWAIELIEVFCKNEKLRPYCQGFYRDITKYLAGAYLKEGKLKEAADILKALRKKMNEHADFSQASAAQENCLEEFGEKGFYNMQHYDQAFADAKYDFLISQIAAMCDEKTFSELKKSL